MNIKSKFYTWINNAQEQDIRIIAPVSLITISSILVNNAPVPISEGDLRPFAVVAVSMLAGDAVQAAVERKLDKGNVTVLVNSIFFVFAFGLLEYLSDRLTNIIVLILVFIFVMIRIASKNIDDMKNDWGSADSVWEYLLVLSVYAPIGVIILFLDLMIFVLVVVTTYEII